MKIKDRLNICLITDKNYIDLTLSCIWSIVKTRKTKLPIHFYVLGDNADLSIFKKFSTLKNTFIYTENIDLKWYIPKTYKFKHCTNTVQMDLLLPIIPVLKELDRVLYLDSDLIIKQDLESLYMKDLKGKSLGGVKDFGKGCVYNKTPVNLDTYKYINAGVMLMDIKKLRAQEFTVKCLSWLEKHNQIDQDIINTLFQNNIYFLEPKYNFSWHKQLLEGGNYLNINLYNKMYKTKYKSIEDLNKDAVILHFHGNKTKMIEKNQKIKELFKSYSDSVKKWLASV